LETIAANRAFVRAVRNFLGVHIVGSDEIDASKKGTPAIIEEDNESALPSSQGMLEKTAKNSNINSFEDFQDYLRNAWKMGVYKNAEAKVWTSYNDIPAKEARILMSILKDK
jgi:uncharacterized protein YbcV (DUF1398 family)